VLLGVLLRHDEAVEVADVAGRQGLLEQMFPGARRRRRLPHAPTLPRAEPRIVAGGGHVPQQHVVGLGHGGVRRCLERKLAIGRVLRCKVCEGLAAAVGMRGIGQRRHAPQPPRLRLRWKRLQRRHLVGRVYAGEGVTNIAPFMPFRVILVIE